MSEELIRKMDEGFARMDAEFEEMTTRFGEMDTRFGQVDVRLGRLEDVTHKQGILLERNTLDIQLFAEKIGTIEATVDRRLTEFESKLDNRLIPLEQTVRNTAGCSEANEDGRLATLNCSRRRVASLSRRLVALSPCRLVAS